ncbi:MAG: hypothetical protein U5N26_06600 [Candidatus Marinimicrobia bacterium]|nr:hypothetical protein [Candidatus Neomarinimicrobiota bacterium]
MEHSRRFLDIPYDEHIVPFPNTAAVILQHAREFPEKKALVFRSEQYRYGDLAALCFRARMPEKEVTLSLKDLENDLPLLLICLFNGIPVHIDFQSDTNVCLSDVPLDDAKDILPELPFVRLDKTAVLLKAGYRFSQYNLLVAAQAAGIAFKLFRPGDAVCALPVRTLPALCFGILAPLYFAKTIRFDSPNPADEVLRGTAQYARAGETTPSLPFVKEKLLRSAAILFDRRNEAFASPVAFYLETETDHAAGLAPVSDHTGKLLSFLGAEMEKQDGRWGIRGHCVGAGFVIRGRTGSIRGS